MNKDFIELKTTENQTVYIRPEQVGAFEVVPASQRVDGHIKIFIGGFKYTVQIEKEELIRKLKGQ
jgi:hypothetical protein